MYKGQSTHAHSAKERTKTSPSSSPSQPSPPPPGDSNVVNDTDRASRSVSFQMNQSQISRIDVAETSVVTKLTGGGNAAIETTNGGKKEPSVAQLKAQVEGLQRGAIQQVSSNPNPIDVSKITPTVADTSDTNTAELRSPDGKDTRDMMFQRNVMIPSNIISHLLSAKNRLLCNLFFFQ